VVLRGPISPSLTLIEATIGQLAPLLTWVNCQRFQKDRFPSIVVDTPNCANIPNWLKLLEEAKEDFIAERTTKERQLTEQEEAARFDKLMRRWLAKEGIDDECLPDSLARWLVTASGTPIAVADIYRWMLVKPAEVLVDSPDFSTADLEELIEQLEDWQHPTLLRLHALRTLRKKLTYAKALKANLATDLDWLLDNESENQEKIASHGTFTIEAVGTHKEQQPQPTISPEAEAEKLAAIKARQAEMAAKAKARLEALRAGKPII
jgi:hypothetical protein